MKPFLKFIADRRSYRHAKRAIAGSAWFDPAWYVARIPQAAADPLGHYCRCGWREGRDPGPHFSTSGYLRAHPDVALADINPLLHFVTTGQGEGRWPAGTIRTGDERFPRAGASNDAGMTVGIVFLIDLIQDVSVLRPLLLMAVDYDLPISILLSGRFAFLDPQGRWQAEIAAMADEAGAKVRIFGEAEEALGALPERGLVFSASESSAPAHALNHAVFKRAPRHLRKVTVQHGFECLGFRHNREHDRVHGETVHFGADTVCAWYTRPALTAFDQGGITDLLVTGPTSLLYDASAEALLVHAAADAPGLICENLHSVRYLADPGLVDEFIDGLSMLCASESERAISLRPHPAGAFVATHRDRLPRNVRLEEGPIWTIDLQRHAYAVCSASSFAVDTMLAGVPTAIWQDRAGQVDTSAFDGLTKISSPDEWIEFARRARTRPEEFIQKQNRWLRDLGFVTDPAQVRTRFARLFDEFAVKAVQP